MLVNNILASFLFTNYYNMKVTNNQWMVFDVPDKAIDILAIVYANWIYSMQQWEYREIESFLVKNWFVHWEIFSWKFRPIPWLNIIQEILTQWKDNDIWSKVLDNLFGKQLTNVWN
jgi:hypothetical protein